MSMKEDAMRYEEQKRSSMYVDPLDEAFEDERMKSIGSTELGEEDHIEELISLGEQV